MKAITNELTDSKDNRMNDILWRETWKETLISNSTFTKYMHERRKKTLN
jgi:hypothetical protein